MHDAAVVGADKHSVYLEQCFCRQFYFILVSVFVIIANNSILVNNCSQWLLTNIFVNSTSAWKLHIGLHMKIAPLCSRRTADGVSNGRWKCFVLSAESTRCVWVFVVAFIYSSFSQTMQNSRRRRCHCEHITLFSSWAIFVFVVVHRPIRKTTIRAISSASLADMGYARAAISEQRCMLTKKNQMQGLFFLFLCSKIFLTCSCWGRLTQTSKHFIYTGLYLSAWLKRDSSRVEKWKSFALHITFGLALRTLCMDISSKTLNSVFNSISSKTHKIQIL